MRAVAYGLLLAHAAVRVLMHEVRSNPRVVKRKMSNVQLKRAEHDQPPKPQHCFREAVAVQPPPVIERPHPLPAIRATVLVERG
jgi:hypothetical protein